MQPAEQPVQLRLVPDVAGQHRPARAVFQGHPVEDRLEACTEPAAQDDAVSARGHGQAPVPRTVRRRRGGALLGLGQPEGAQQESAFLPGQSVLRHLAVHQAEHAAAVILVQPGTS